MKLDPTTLVILQDWIEHFSLLPILKGRLEDLDLHHCLEALEWAVVNGKHPLVVDSFRCPYRWWMDSGTMAPPFYNHLPVEVYEKRILENDGINSLQFRKKLDAWHWLLVEWGTWELWK